MLMKDVSFWCVVLAIVIIFVVHHILSSFNIIEGLDEEIPSLVDQDLQNDDSVDNVTRVNNDTMKLNDEQMSISMSFENDNSRPILNDMNKQSNPLLPISSERDMNVASSQNATQQRSNGTLLPVAPVAPAPVAPAPVAPATAPTIIIPQQMPGNFTGGLSGNTQTTKEIITPKKNEPSAKELGDAYIEGVKSVIKGRKLIQEYLDEKNNKKLSETPSETTSETPNETTSETPNETTSETPNETTSETTSETPTETTSETPTETIESFGNYAVSSYTNFGPSVVPSPNPQDDVSQYYESF